MCVCLARLKRRERETTESPLAGVKSAGVAGVSSLARDLGT